MSSSSLPDSSSPNKSAQNKSAQKSAIVPLVICALLALFVAVSALPRYASSWPWTTPPKVANQTALQSLRDQGLTLPEWTTEEQLRRKISGADWSIQQLSHSNATADPSTVVLLLRPQIWEKDQPEVEWVDIKGSQQWKTDSYQTLSFSAPTDQSAEIKPDFFRAWNQTQTYAVLQWYAWPSGGSASVAKWFWADQQMQWRYYQRLPWVAVSLWLPIEPLSDITPYQTLAQNLGEKIQTNLSNSVFTGKRL
ncbi:cyanoexosortase B system-associated protein [cf. Phormidesmis sp. LEGE 11477]|uniref:cyanoexosortase B system-associated protein n=1 Tax=cf. Phormidesmis sp. LEGE 11477 TaxID=1828680 RepID=UPI0018819B4F|nr:cyanoexosortase B system-associated protein [cf. Phormidesmis sp. LEGE 11477]